VLAAHDAVAQAPLRERMHGLGVFSTLILCGPLMAPVGDFFLAEFAALPRVGARDFRTPAEVAADLAKAPLSPQDDGPAWRARRVAAEKTDGIIWSAARVRAGAVVVVKFGAPVPEAARRWVGGMLVRQGGVRAVFGEHALLCVV
jgi:urease accessory protein